MIVDRLRSLFDRPASAADIKRGTDWRRVRSDTRWQFVQETARGVQLKRELCREYEHMVTGERALLARTDERFEWYDRDADGEWPAHARRAVVDGEVWHGEVDHDSQMDALGPVWGHIRMGGTWRRES